MPQPIHGLVPILATPFDATGGLDVRSLTRLVEFELSAGADGLATFGLASEGFALTVADRAQILATLTTVAGPAVPIVAGVNATSTATALEQAHAAVDGGAGTLMVLPPFQVKPSGGQLLDFYGTLATATGVDIMVQDAPNVTGVSMPVDLLVELSKLAGVTSVKVEAPPTAPKVGQVADAVEAGFGVFGGQNALFVLEEYSRGAIGTMPACEFADLLAPALAAYGAGRSTQARTAVGRLQPLIRFGLQGPIAWAVHKHVLVRRGIIETAVVRSPAAPLDPASARDLDTILDDLRMPEWTG